jgi:ComF family protein
MTEQDTTAETRRVPLLSRAAGALASAAHGAGNLLVPPLCLACRRPLAGHDALCAPCWSSIRFIRAPLCDRLGIPLPFDPCGGPVVSAGALSDPPVYDRARAVARYDETIRRLVRELKYKDRHDACRLMGRLMAGAGTDLLVDADVLVPVPLHRWRLLWRRFNQAQVLAREVSRLSRVPVAPLALIRRRRTPPQVGLSASQRRRNLAGAFHVQRPAEVAGRRVVLVDDVITTGATADAAARVLRAAGALRVDVLALARVTGDEVPAP